MRKLLGAVALAGMLLVPAAANAQLTVGPMAAYHDDNVNFGIGGFADIAVPSLDPNLSIMPSVMFYFPDDPFSFWEVNGDVLYRFEVSPDTPVLPFAMAGLNIATAGIDGGPSNTDIGLNLGGGIGFRSESLSPFVGAKFEIQDGSSFVLFGGVGFTVGG
jgi:hypothetical protein